MSTSLTRKSYSALYKFSLFLAWKKDGRLQVLTANRKKNILLKLLLLCHKSHTALSKETCTANSTSGSVVAVVNVSTACGCSAQAVLRSSAGARLQLTTESWHPSSGLDIRQKSMTMTLRVNYTNFWNLPQVKGQLCINKQMFKFHSEVNLIQKKRYFRYSFINIHSSNILAGLLFFPDMAFFVHADYESYLCSLFLGLASDIRLTLSS